MVSVVSGGGDRHPTAKSPPNMMSLQPREALDKALAIIEAAPESAGALTLYALINTLEYERAGRLFKLTKLHDLDPDQRAVAYGLMEFSVVGTIGDDAWDQAKARMDRAVRGI
jgi:hypothetical protein